MEVLNKILGRYINFSLLELFLFLISGLALYFFFQKPQLILGTIGTQQINLNSSIINIFFIILWFLIYITIKKALVFTVKFLLSFREYEFESHHWPSKWEYQGNIRLGEDKNSLFITDSNSGGILKNYYWKNVNISFDCKFQVGKDGTLGIIFRAKNLSDYFMIQINNKERRITPHIRISGLWETNEEPTYDPPLTVARFYKITLQAVNENVKLFIDGNQTLDWNIPTNSDIKLTKILNRLSMEEDSQKADNSLVPRIDFRNQYGQIGFRSFPGESAIIKNLIVRRIATTL